MLGAKKLITKNEITPNFMSKFCGLKLLEAKFKVLTL